MKRLLYARGNQPRTRDPRNHTPLFNSRLRSDYPAEFYPFEKKRLTNLFFCDLKGNFSFLDISSITGILKHFCHIIRFL
jgi:hypothetical protein